jgi:hypothetical protein
MYHNYFQQVGGVKCSICGIEGKNKASHFDVNGNIRAPHGGASGAKASNVKCELGPGFYILQNVSMTLHDTKINKVLKPNQKPLSAGELNKVVADCSHIKLELLNTEETPVEIVEVVQASSPSGVTVGDVLDAFLNNNKKLLEVSGGELGSHIYYEGIEHKGGNLFSMINFGS